MTTPQSRPRMQTGMQRPEGWPVGSFDSYAQAQEAVDMLSDRSFAVEELTIVGVDLMQVEKVIGRLTWGRVLASGAASGAWLGLFFGMMLGLFGTDWLSAVTTGIFMGVIFGLVFAAVPYAASRGKRDFASSTQIVAGRYDVLCSPNKAHEARDIIAAYLTQKH
ncbi:general stress protein [Corynebacterium gerontici]|uniref:General stress protein 17M-like domain-containing protein n=1 Tax=Corynebacterium gerontici TaxID=2079234 RepID=A0A3G6IZT8_9CORY|nr:general stress protein [Corynebacterium gerontici]AZA11176.1 hypothetical protein CGERO_04295 [Corynebacterium gerontici]